MRFRVVTLLSVAVIALVGACPSEVNPGGSGVQTECTLDEECLNGSVCVEGACVPPLPIGEEGEGEEGEGEEGEGEGDTGGEGEGEGDTGGEGEGEGEGELDPLAQTLFVSAGPELVDALPGCGCAAPAPAANVNLEYSSSTATCTKPADAVCGLDGANCPCNIGAGNGTAKWGGSRVEQPRQPEENWIIDEAIEHVAAPTDNNGTFVARVALSNACLLSPGSLSANVNNACCMLDCDSGSGAQACYDYSSAGSCGTFCPTVAQIATNNDCMATTGEAPVRIHVEVDGVASFTREWCTTMATGAALDVVEIQRSNGRFNVVAFDPALTEIAVGAPCP